MADTFEAIAALTVDVSGDVEVTLLERADRPPTGVSRLGGPGVALGDRHPMARHQRMTHLWTFATADVPTLRQHYPDAAAVAMYLRSPGANEAYQVDSGETALVVLSELDVGGPRGTPTPDDLPEEAVVARTVAVPSSAFEPVRGDSDDSLAGRLYHELFTASAYAGGRPIWIQGAEHDGRFLLQFSDGFLGVNLGDAGIMYVFADQQFWQCC